LVGLLLTGVDRNRVRFGLLAGWPQLAEGRLTVGEEHEFIGLAIEIKIGDRTDLILRERVELLNEVDLIVEIAVGVAAKKDATVVDLLNVGSTVEVRVDGDGRELASPVEVPPDVGTAVGVSVFG